MDRFQAMQMYVQVVDAGSFSAKQRILISWQPAVSKTTPVLKASGCTFTAAHHAWTHAH
ncbi:hypothetical protein LZ023_37055 (plasmid) [Pseudomonas silvicola]|nr:hypothetical protein LZ023_37055 [Pseudomonas silvicola]